MLSTVKNTLLKLFSILFVILFLHSCSTIGELAKIRKPDLSIQDVRVTNMSLQDVELTFDIEVDNPNALAIDLSSYNYDLNINERSFVNGNATKGMEIGPQKSSTISIPVRLGYQELYDTFTGLRGQDETSYDFKAELGFALPVLGETKMPIQHEGTFPVVKVPRIDLGNLVVENISVTKADLSLNLQVDNPNAFGLIIDRLTYDLDVNGLISITGQTVRGLEISEKSDGTLKIPLTINFLNAGMAAYRILNGEENLEYNLEGSAAVGATLPFFDLSTFNFDKSGTVNILR